jgi:6-pyruvoyltetrahydropterin/6-carboxytetrahydropterin synthase
MSDPVRITRAIEFSSSLRLRSPGLSEAENRARFGRLADRHGHNYRLEVSLLGVPDARTGMLIDLKDVKDALEREVMARFDHRDLNDDGTWFEKRPPSAENFAALIFELLDGAFPGGLLDRVRLYEGPDHWVDVERGTAP